MNTSTNSGLESSTRKIRSAFRSARNGAAPFGRAESRIFRTATILFTFFLFCGCAKYIVEIPHEPPADFPSETNVARQTVSIAMDLSGRNLAYSAKAKDFRDCSGVFHRFINELRKSCPGITGPDKSDRSSRRIAQWYAFNGRLFLIQNVFEQDWMIRPGAVMFYGQRRKHYRNVTLGTALKEIGHIGIVTSASRSPSGKVLSYELFHGRSRGKPAAITTYHKRSPVRKGYHPLGNADQQLIGIAWLCETASCDCAIAEGNNTLSMWKDARLP